MARHNLIPMEEAMRSLRKKGYTEDFRLEKDHLVINGKNSTFTPAEITIEEQVRFEGDSNPDDMSILYAIATSSGDKGLIVNGYGISADRELDAFLRASEE